MNPDQSTHIAPLTENVLLRPDWIVAGLLMLVTGGAVIWLCADTLSDHENESAQFWIGYAVAKTFWMALIPVIVAACTRFRRPWVVLMVWVPIAAFFLLGAIGTHEIREGRITGTTPSIDYRKADVLVPQSVNHSVTDTDSVTDKVAWDDLKPVSVSAAAEDANWNNDVATFMRAHPALIKGQNVQLMQLHLNELANAGLSNVELLRRAYLAAERDARWSQVP